MVWICSLRASEEPARREWEALGLSSHFSCLAACRRERSKISPDAAPGRKSFTARGKARERKAIERRTASVMMRPVGGKHAVALGLCPEDGMEALEIEGQTDQTPLARGSLLSPQRELAEA
jgi:hypothetical protein